MAKLPAFRYARTLPPLVLILLFCWAAWERFRLPLTPCADPDVWVYLLPGLTKLNGGSFTHVYGQCFLYPWFLYVVLRLGHDFRWVALVQQGFGLGTGALLFGCWMQLRSFMTAPRLPAVAFKLTGIVLAGVYLLSTATIQFERAFRPESIFPFFVVLNIYCNLRFIHDRYHGGNSWRAVLCGATAVFLSVAAWLLKPSFAVGLLLTNLPVLLSLARPGASARNKCLLVGLPTVVAGVLLIWPEWHLRRGDQEGALFLTRSLFCVHAGMIADQMGEDLARHATAPYPPEFVAAAHDALSESLRESRAMGTHWPALGFDPDYLLYGGTEKPSFANWITARMSSRPDEASSPEDQPRQGPPADRRSSREKQVAFYGHYYARVWRRHPTWMAAKALRQFGVFYRLGLCPAYFAYGRFNLAGEYRLSAACLEQNPLLRSYPPGAVLLARTEAHTAIAGQIGPYPLTAKLNRGLALSYFPACLWAVALGIGAWRVPRLRGAFGGAIPVLLWLYSYNFSTVLTLSFTHSLDVDRYSQYQLAYTLLPQFWAIWLGVEALELNFPGAFAAAALFGQRIWKRVRGPSRPERTGLDG